MPGTMKSVSSVVWTLKLFGQGIYEVNQLNMGGIWSVMPESKIKESREFEFSAEDRSVRILLKIKVLPELATKVNPIVGEE